MKAVSATCPRCGAPMKINRIKGILVCEYCDNILYIKKPKVELQKSSVFYKIISEHTGSLWETVKFILTVLFIVFVAVLCILVIIGLIFRNEDIYGDPLLILGLICFFGSIAVAIKHDADNQKK